MANQWGSTVRVVSEDRDQGWYRAAEKAVSTARTFGVSAAPKGKAFLLCGPAVAIYEARETRATSCAPPAIISMAT